MPRGRIFLLLLALALLLALLAAVVVPSIGFADDIDTTTAPVGAYVQTSAGADTPGKDPPRFASCGDPPRPPAPTGTPSPTATTTATAPTRPPTAVPTAPFSPTPTAIAATSTPKPTSTRVHTPTAIAATSTPKPTSTRVHTPTAIAATSTPKPTSTRIHTPTAIAATSTPTLTPVSVSVPPAATVKPVSTQIPGSRIAARPDPGRNCIPHHAAAPIRLCQTGSGSGWWIYDTQTGQILHDNEGRLAHVPFNESLPTGQVQVLFKSSRLLAVWLGSQVVISTTYADGKAYVFSIFSGGRTAHWNW